MFRVARAIRPVGLAARSSLNATKPSVFRVLSTTPRVRSGAPPQIFGPGAKPGEVPSDAQQATGLERLQLLGEMDGFNAFDPNPLDSSRIGTKANPILVPSLDITRIVGCTGSPADSHDILWFNLGKERQERCTECGSVYALDFQGVEDHHDQGHH